MVAACSKARIETATFNFRDFVSWRDKTNNVSQEDVFIGKDGNVTR